MIYLGNGVVECSLFVYNRGIETQGNCESRMRDICRRRGGIDYMCKVSKELFHDGWMEGQRSGLKEGQRLGLKEGQRLGLKEGQRIGLLEANVKLPSVFLRKV